MLALFCAACTTAPSEQKTDPVVIAYVTSWTDVMPDPQLMTHINYAFGHVNDSFNGVRIDNEARLRQIVALKEKNPELKVLLSIGGWGSGRFSEMAADEGFRLSFAEDCDRVVKEFGLDGIDIDWEYPTNPGPGISFSENDTDNFTLLMRDIRKAIGNDKLLTIATVANANYIDFRSCVKYLDLVNAMTYDMGNPPQHHSALYPSENSGWVTTSEGIEAHLNAGVPAHKLVVGMPLYGRGERQFPEGYTIEWDDVAQVPYIADAEGNLINGYDNPRSLAIKCQYLLDKGLRGAMYWEYGDDNEKLDKVRTIYNCVIARGAEPYTEGGYAANYASAPRFKALLCYDPHAEEAHVQFAEQSIEFFHKLSYGTGYILEVSDNFANNYQNLDDYDILIMVNASPRGREQRAAFEDYMESGGGWLGFHAAAYNDRNTRWDWYNEFLGCGKFYCNNWPPQAALVDNEAPEHPIMKTMPESFVIPESEYYQWDPSPRLNPDVKVLLSISPKMYPFGIKDIVKGGDFPLVWTNTKYRMVYINMGHGDTEYIDATQNLLFVNAFRWVLSTDPKGNPFNK